VETSDGTRTLLLLRHAKSSRPVGVADFDRPLSHRGRRDAQAAGRQLATWGLSLDLALCSPSVRTRETWEQAVLGGAEAAEVSFRSEIYEATWAELAAVIATVTDDVSTLLLVGHGPGIPGLAEHLAGDDAAHGTLVPGAAELAQGFPTCGLARFATSAPWSDLSPAGMEMTEFVVPREG
jgi:phosphohistidine phosphatase